MNTKHLCALACACASLSSQAFTLDVSYLQDGWNYSLTIGTDIAPVAPGVWKIDGNQIGYGGSRPYNPFGFSQLPENYASIWYLAPGEHIVSFACDDGSGLVLTGDEPYIISDPTGERIAAPQSSQGNSVPETLGGAWLGLVLAGMVGVKRFH